MAEPSRDVFQSWHGQALGAIEDDAELTLAARKVGRRLCQLVKWERRYAWPKQTTLAADLKLSKRQVIRAAQQLVERGHFRVWRAGRQNRYVPKWVGALADPTSRLVWLATDAPPETACGKTPSHRLVSENPAKGDTDVTYSGGKGDTDVTYSGGKGDTNVTYKKDHHNSSTPQGAPVDSPCQAPSAPAGGNAGADGSQGREEEPNRQHQLPLVAKVADNSLPEPTPEERKALALERVDADVQGKLGGAYPDMLPWLSDELLERAVQSELAKPGTGAALILNAWAASGDCKVAERDERDSAQDTTATQPRRSQGAA